MTNPFDYVNVGPEAVIEIANVREAYKALYGRLMALPASRERSLAVTKLEESAMWTIKGISHNQPDHTMVVVESGASL